MWQSRKRTPQTVCVSGRQDYWIGGWPETSTNDLERGLTVKRYARRTEYVCVHRTPQRKLEKSTNRTGTVAIDGAQKGARGMYSAIGNGSAQFVLDHEGEPKYG